ncbi:unnamed protein product [Didymodactylos carnosus]|uniref:Uncharacterized protein n=2 Tax=Didymodactylos carnosus TaxID=1234261 RepID=A0A8S2IFL0_9BILA|nr:unnamed protein product [Didymodactylos carnosus]CAF3723272.1 unnamed protein product [Didymodactylos carnosus]
MSLSYSSYYTFLYLVFILNQLPVLTTNNRPTFDPQLHFTKDYSRYSDLSTGLPASQQLIEQTLDLKKEDLQSKFRTLSKTNINLEYLNFVKLNSKAKLHPTACIALNVIEQLQTVECLQQQLKLTFDTQANAQLTYTKWLSLISKINYINGGKEWGCINVTTQQPVVIMKRIVHHTMELIKNQITINVTNETNISPLVCFSNLTMSMALEQMKPKIIQTTTTTTKTTEKSTPL